MVTAFEALDRIVAAWIERQRRRTEMAAVSQ